MAEAYNTLAGLVQFNDKNLAELKGRAGSIPNQGILIDTLMLQEAAASSEIENIVTIFQRSVTFDSIIWTAVIDYKVFSPLFLSSTTSI